MIKIIIKSYYKRYFDKKLIIKGFYQFLAAYYDGFEITTYNFCDSQSSLRFSYLVLLN